MLDTLVITLTMLRLLTNRYIISIIFTFITLTLPSFEHALKTYHRVLCYLLFSNAQIPWLLTLLHVKIFTKLLVTSANRNATDVVKSQQAAVKYLKDSEVFKHTVHHVLFR